MTMVPVDPSWKDPTQRVEYFGQTENTRFGLVMFEADRYLKSLAAGKDTLTGTAGDPQPSPASSPNSSWPSSERTEVPWHRNWFLPGESRGEAVGRWQVHGF